MTTPRTVAASAAALLTVGIGACAPEADQPGNPAVYDRIDGLTDCDELQAEFDAAADNNGRAEPGTDLFDATLGYMQASEARRQELDCG